MKKQAFVINFETKYHKEKIRIQESIEIQLRLGRAGKKREGCGTQPQVRKKNCPPIISSQPYPQSNSDDYRKRSIKKQRYEKRVTRKWLPGKYAMEKLTKKKISIKTV